MTFMQPDSADIQSSGQTGSADIQSSGQTGSADVQPDSAAKQPDSAAKQQNLQNLQSAAQTSLEDGLSVCRSLLAEERKKEAVGVFKQNFEEGKFGINLKTEKVEANNKIISDIVSYQYK